MFFIGTSEMVAGIDKELKIYFERLVGGK